MQETGTDGRRPTSPLLLSRCPNIVSIMRLHEAQSVGLQTTKMSAETGAGCRGV